jgi:6-phosphogluconolactonase
MNLQILKSPEDLGRAAARHFVAKSREAIAKKGRFTVALSGGSTPKRLYELLAERTEPFRDQIAWEKIHFFWSDERHVPSDHPESNYRMTYEALLSCVPVAEDNVHRIAGENPNAAEAAAQYEETLKRVTGETLPQLDLILLGLGTDGHTASIFPGSEVLQETERLVAAAWVEKFKSYRITMTLPLLNNGRSVVFLVSGDEKAEIVKEVLEGPERYPAQAIKPEGELLWLLDEAAAVRVE